MAMSGRRRTRRWRRRPTAERSAGAFVAPDMPVPVPMRTISNDHRDVPTAPEEEPRPEPEPERETPGLLTRLVDRLIRRAHPRD